MQHENRHTAITDGYQNGKHLASRRMDEQIQKGCNHRQNQHLHQRVANKLQDVEGGKGILLPQVFHGNHNNDGYPINKSSDKREDKAFQQQQLLAMNGRINILHKAAGIFFTEEQR